MTASYDAGPLVIGGELVDSRAFFERRHSSAGTTEINALEPLQAYVATDFSDRLSAKAGRFTLNLGSRRLIARNNFRNTINGFTGVQADAGDNKLGATAFWTVAQTRLPSDLDALRDNAAELDRARGSPHVFGAFAHATLGGGTAETYAFRLAENDARGIATRDRHLWTLGARVARARAKGRWDVEVEVATQAGTVRATSAATDRTTIPVAAGFAHASVGRTLQGAWQPRLQLAFDVASGERRGGRYTRFDTLYGSRGFDFGPTSLYGAVTRANLVSAELRGEVRPDARTDAYLALRPLWLASATDGFASTDVRDPTGRAGRHAGTQVEGRIRRWLAAKTLQLNAGAALLFKGRFLRDAANAPDTGAITRYTYLELAFTP